MIQGQRIKKRFLFPNLNVGTVFTYESVQLKIVDCGKNNECGNCYFKAEQRCKARGIVACTAKQREKLDGISVKFIQVK